MANKQRPSLLSLPTELRSAIHQHVIVDCLHEGTVSDIASLFFSCRTIHHDLLANFMHTTKPLLQAQHAWKAIAHVDLQHVHLRITLETPPHLAPSKTTLHITVPVQTVPDTDHPSRAFVGLDATATILNPIFASQWAELRFSFQNVEARKLSTFLQYTLLIKLFDELVEDVFARTRVQRLVFNCANEQDPPSEPIFWRLLAVLNRARRRRYGGHSIKRTWMERVSDGREKGWKLSMDFAEGLGQVDGALWVLEDDEAGFLRIERLFGSLNEEEGAELVGLEEKYMEFTAQHDREERQRERSAGGGGEV